MPDASLESERRGDLEIRREAESTTFVQHVYRGRGCWWAALPVLLLVNGAVVSTGVEHGFDPEVQTALLIFAPPLLLCVVPLLLPRRERGRRVVTVGPTHLELRGEGLTLPDQRHALDDVKHVKVLVQKIQRSAGDRTFVEERVGLAFVDPEGDEREVISPGRREPFDRDAMELIAAAARKHVKALRRGRREEGSNG